MCIPDYDLEARDSAKVLGYRLIHAEIEADTTLYGWVEFAQWSATLPDQFVSRKYWYEVRFKPIGKRWKDNWQLIPPSSDPPLNRLHFSVLERSAAHPKGATSVAKLGPMGHIRTEPKSVGLGTYLRDELIDWVASLHPNASVARGMLSPVDGAPENLKRRNRFYEAGGFQIRVHDDGSGAFWADRLDGLRRQKKENGNVIELVKEDVNLLLKSLPDLEEVKRKVTHLDDQCRRLRTANDKAQRSIFWYRVGAVALLFVLLFMTAQGKLSWRLF